jgi:hypothetical protein
MSAITAHIRSDMIDALIDLYCDWREECTEVRAAYERLSNTPRSDRPLAYAAYAAALDREGSAAGAYEAHVKLLTGQTEFAVRSWS